MGAASPRKSRRDVKGLIKQARRAERTVEICLRADLRAEAADVERRIFEVQETAAQSESLAGVDGDPVLVELAHRQEEIRGRMLEHTLVFRLQGLPRRRWTELLAAYPPREDNEADRLMGVNFDDFAETLVRECTVEPELDDDDWQALLTDALTDAAWQALSNAAWAVNTRDVSVPFSLAASRILRTSESG